MDSEDHHDHGVRVRRNLNPMRSHDLNLNASDNHGGSAAFSNFPSHYRPPTTLLGSRRGPGHEDDSDSEDQLESISDINRVRRTRSRRSYSPGPETGPDVFSLPPMARPLGTLGAGGQFERLQADYDTEPDSPNTAFLGPFAANPGRQRVRRHASASGDRDHDLSGLPVGQREVVLPVITDSEPARQVNWTPRRFPSLVG